MTKVICTVSNCKYWEEGNGCSADSILITSDNDALGKPDPEGKTQVENVFGTACYTFEKKRE